MFDFRPVPGVTKAISNFTAAAQVGVAPGAGTGALTITDAERQRILEEEQRQLDQLKVGLCLLFRTTLAAVTDLRLHCLQRVKVPFVGCHAYQFWSVDHGFYVPVLM